jgi:hypothetical protein
MGELDDVSSIDVAKMVQPMDSKEAVAFIQRLLELAFLTKNEGWLQWLATLPCDAHWTEQIPWMGPEFLEKVLRLLDILSRQKSSEGRSLEHVFNEVAARLRIWSRSPKFAGEMARNEGRLLLDLLSIVAALDPSNDTLEWLTSSVRDVYFACWGALEALPRLVNSAHGAHVALDGRRLVDLFVRAAVLRRGEAGLQPDGQRPKFPNLEHERTTVALIGSSPEKGAHKGLLSLAPTLFLPVAFDMLSGFTVDDETQRKFGLAPRWVSARMVDDSDSVILGPTAYEHDQLTDWIRARLASDVAGGGRFIQEIYWPSARDSHSAFTWLLLLEATASQPERYASIFDEMLLRPEIYRVPQARAWLQQILGARWPHLSRDAKENVLQHIRTAAVESDSDVLAAPLLSVIPERDRPDWGQDCLREYADKGFATKLQPSQEAKRTASWVEFETRGDWAGVAKRWLSTLPGLDEAKFHEAIDDLNSLLSKNLPSDDSDDEVSTALMVLDAFVRNAATRKQQGKTKEPLLSEPQLRRIIDWTFEVASASPSEELNRNPSPVEPGKTPDDERHRWIFAIELLNRLLLEPPVKDDLELNRRFFAEISRVSASPTPALAWHLFRVVQPYNWVRPGSAGRQHLEELLGQKVNDVGALSQAFSHVVALGDAGLAIFRRWLITPQTWPDTAPSKFMNELGAFMADALFQDSETASQARELIYQTLGERPAAGPLSRMDAYESWLLGLTFGAKESFVRLIVNGMKHCDAELFGSIINRLWSAAGVDGFGYDSGRFIIFALQPLTMLAKEPSRTSESRTLWDCMEDWLANTVKHGVATVAFRAIFSLREPTLIRSVGSTRMRRFLDTVASRVKRLGEESLRADLMNGLDHASQMTAEVAQLQDATDEVRSWAHALLDDWSNLGNQKAIEMAHKVRRL